MEIGKTIKAKIKEGVYPGNHVYVSTSDHGFVEAEVIKVSNKNNKIKSVTVKYVDDFIKETYGADEIVYMESNLQKIVPKGSEIIRPSFWMNQNRKEFPEWVTKTFLRYNTCSDFKGKEKGRCPLYSYQGFIRDYLGHNSPFRGLLLYHGLGSGKTVSAVSVTENLKDTRNIVIFLPASLRTNFINDGLKKCGDVLYKEPIGNKLVQERYSFISYNSSNVVAQIDNLGSLDNKIIVVDEAHNLGTMMVNGLSGSGRQGAEVYRKLVEAKNSKLIFLTGTPLVNTPFEVAILFNLLRGLMEVVFFNVKNFSENTIENFLGEIIEDNRIGHVDLNRRNKSFMVLLKVHSWDMEFEQTIRYIEKKAFNYQAILEFSHIDKFTLFPETEEEFNSFFVKDDEFYNKNTFQRRILGLCSYYKGISPDKSDDFPKLEEEVIVEVPMSSHQFEIYEMAREEERKKERQAAYQKRQERKKQEQTPTLARVFSREFSNFVFPDSIIRPFKAIQFISAALQKEKEDEIKSKLIKGEINEEEAKLLKKPVLSKEKWENKLKEALEKVSNPEKPYLKIGPDGLNRYSPKMMAMLQEIQKNKEGLILVYSAFRKVEGLEIFSRILERNGYQKFSQTNINPEYNFKRFSFFSGQEDFKEREIITNTFTDPENNRGKLLRILLVSSAGTEGLDLKNIRKVLIMEPFWHEIRIKQVVGRAVRKNSHRDLPEKERKVEVYRYLSVFSPEQKKLSKEKVSTDEYVLATAKKKEFLNQDVLEAVKEASVDCALNQCDNDMKGKCFHFYGNKQGLAYLPDLTRDIVYGYEQTKTREVKRKVMIAGITKKNEIFYKKTKSGPWYLGNGEKLSDKPKMIKEKKFAYDPERMKVYDYEILKKTGLLNEIGRVNEYGKLIPN
jgi:superfamily II DNA or RNA helicase